jgi:hypothetical protein
VTATTDVQAELVAWIAQHPELQGEGGAIDVVLRLLDHAYAEDGTDEPGLLSAHTPTLRRVTPTETPDGRGRVEIELPLRIMFTVSWPADATVTDIGLLVNSAARDVVTAFGEAEPPRLPHEATVTAGELVTQATSITLLATEDADGTDRG